MTRMLLAAAMLLCGLPAAGEDLSVLPGKEMMHAYLMDAARKAFDRHDAEYEKLKTPEQITEYQQRMKQFFIDQLGGLPERTPLNPQVVAKEDRDGYRVEKVIFESRPKHFVTGLLYLPNAEPPYPGVLVPCGHSGNGKASELYQRASILLAKNGMASFCYDPIDQGERFQLLDEKGKPREGGTIAHCLVGVGSILVGRNTASFRIWDGMRAIDYLQSRPEIDPKRIGCTGNSGGGTLTSYLMALDDRIFCAAPSCYLTSLRRLMETIGAQDAEQNIHAQIGQGMDHADYVMMRAPRPTLMCCATGDFFDIDGAWHSFRQAKRLYTRLGCAERVDLIEVDEKHGFSRLLRIGAVRWMRRWLLAKDDAIDEPEFAVVNDQAAQCTPKGQVMLLEGARSVYDFNRDLSDKLAGDRKKLWQETEPAKMLDEVRRITGIRKLGELPEPQVEKKEPVQRDGYRIDKLVIRPEPGIWLPALAFMPEKPDGGAYLYLHQGGKAADAAPGGPIETLVRQGHVVLAVDLRGIGETQTPGNGKYAQYLGPGWKDTSLAYMLGRPYLTMRAEDVLASARVAARYEAGDKPRRVRVVSIGRVGVPALHAAALEPQLIESVRLEKCLDSWSDVVAHPTATNQYENAIHGALKAYDLPELRGTLREKLELVEPLDAVEKPVGKP